MENFIIGGIAATISRTVTAPLELLRIQQQNKFMKQSILSTYKQEGFKSLFKGNGLNCIRIFPQNAISYGLYEALKPNPFAATIAGITAITAIYPIENLRSRFSLQPLQYNTLKNINIRSLYGGLNTSLIGYAAFTTLNYNIYDRLKQHTSLAGGISGMLAVSITYPTDIIRRRMQLQGFHPSVPKYHSISHLIITMYKAEGGLIAFYQGSITTILKMFPTMYINFLIIETLKNI
jgi:solute carrier family 25 (mitochondrial phosphate transporter), member 23/24/25/41